MILQLGIETKNFADDLAWEVVTGGLTIVDAIERLLCEHLEDSAAKALGSRLVKAPQAIIHPRYHMDRFRNLFGLSKDGYSTWYPEVRFATKKSDNLSITQVETVGFEHGYRKYGGGFEQWFKYRKKEMRTQINHSLTLTKLSLPKGLFSQTIRIVRKSGNIEQPLLANLTVGFDSFVDDRIPGFRTVSFDHVVTGVRKFCLCNLEAHTAMLTEANEIAPSYSQGAWPHRMVELIESATYDRAICHFCVAEQRGEEALSHWYGDQIQEHYGPYVDLLVRSSDMDIRTAKAEARRRLSISRWVREDELYRQVTKLFPNEKIRREASPRWLGRQRLDIYLPELALAIEHQGEQHFRPIGRLAVNKDLL